jgi:hypothetical protein
MKTFLFTLLLYLFSLLTSKAELNKQERFFDMGKTFEIEKGSTDNVFLFTAKTHFHFEMVENRIIPDSGEVIIIISLNTHLSEIIIPVNIQHFNANNFQWSSFNYTMNLAGITNPIVSSNRVYKEKSV